MNRIAKNALSLAALLLGSALVACQSAQPTSESLPPAEDGVLRAQLAGFPSFTYDKLVIDPVNLQYNPTNEVIFPSVIDASFAFANPLAKYYMYYAAHDAPGGISLAYSNALNGPWTEYANNPIISNNWSPYYSVSHVSSPHAMWVSEVGQLYLYFHGENTTTRVANTTDGIHFNYDKIIIETSGTYKKIDGLSEVSYARVFKKSITRNNTTYKYTMLLMGNNGGTRKIYVCWSNDARTFACQNTPLITPNAAEGSVASGPQISSPHYFPWNGKHYVTYNAGSGNLHITEVGDNFTLETHLGALYSPSSGAPEYGRVGAATYRTVGTTMYMFYEVGQRSQTKIALAKAPL